MGESPIDTVFTEPKIVESVAIVPKVSEKPVLEPEQIFFEVDLAGKEKHTFTIQKQNIRSGKIDQLFQKSSNDSERIVTEGCMDKNGNVFWVKDKEVLHPDLWKEAIGEVPVSFFEYDSNIKRLFVESPNLTETKALVELSLNSGLDGQADLTVNRVGSTTQIGQGIRENLFIGRLNDWKSEAEDFVPDDQIEKKIGYEKVIQEKSSEKIDLLYKTAREKGKSLIVRTVGLPAEPDGLSSASLIAPGHYRLFDALAGDYDKGALIYETSDKSAKACFTEDARAWVYKKSEAPPLLDSQEKIDPGGDNIIYYKKWVAPITLSQLQEFATSVKPEAGKYYSEVLFDPTDPDTKLVGVVNPLDVWGWSKIAYKHGVLEFQNTPKFNTAF